MAKIGNETKLVLKLAKEKAEAVRLKMSDDGYIALPDTEIILKLTDERFGFEHGLKLYQNILLGIVSELEDERS